MERLPSEIVLDILSRLPVESVLDCKLVCKSLRNLLTSRREHFAKMHHHRQLLQLADGHEATAAASSSVKLGFLFSFVESGEESVGLYYGEKYNDEMNIHENFCYKKLKHTSISIMRHWFWHFLVGSCNGLICLNRSQRGPPDPFCICNPITGEYVNLPEQKPCQDSSGVLWFGYGFGYVVHSITNYEYKVVSYYTENRENGKVQVYTIGSGRGWRNKGTTPYQLDRRNPMGVFADGALHWIQYEDIIAFSLADEEFRLIKSPPCLNPYQSNCLYELQALGEKLCLSQERYEEHRLDIWSLKKNGMEEGWTRDFSIAYGSADLSPIRPLIVTKKNEVLLVHLESRLYCYDPKTTGMIQLWGDDLKLNLNYLHASTHMNSLVSLKALGEDSKMKRGDIEAV